MIHFKQQQQMQMLVQIASSPVSLRRLLFLCLFFLIAAAILPPQKCITTTHSFAILPSSKSLSPSASANNLFSQPPHYHQQEHQRQISSTQHRIPNYSSTATTSKNALKLFSLPSSAADDEINVQVAKARKLIEQAKAKVAAAAEEAEKVTTAKNDDIPSTNEDEIQKRKESVIKTQNEETGLITTDGELMAALSETEDWEARSFGDIFADDTDDLIEDGLASRDVAASIFNLRMKLNDADYRRVFDKRNRFIGEDN